MTRNQRIGLGVLLHMLDKAARDLETTIERAVEAGANYGGFADIGVQLGTLKAAVDFNAKLVRGCFENLRELFPSVEVAKL